jgi:hypothetical protein
MKRSPPTRRGPRPAAASCVAWRDGIHLVGSSIWCDARRARAVCFASQATIGAGQRPGHGQMIATAETLALLGAAGDAHLAVPLRRPFTLGTVRLELLASGHGRGGAGLSADVDGRRVVYTGAINPAGGGRGEPAELRPCDTLVVVAPWGAPHHRFPPPAEATRQVIAACVARAADDVVVVALVDDAVAGLELAALLHGHGLAVAGHRSIVLGANRLIEAGLDAPPVRRAVARQRVLVWPLADRARLPATLRGLPTAMVLASGLATEPDVAATADVAIAWSLAGDRDALLGVVRSSNATDVVLIGPGAEPLAAAIGGRARVLGPPRQMPLFAAGA